MHWLATDQGAHFMTTLTTKTMNDAHICHHFMILYCRTESRTIESLRKEVFRTTRTILTDWKSPSTYWPCIIDTIEKIINQYTLSVLGKKDHGPLQWPWEVFTGLKQPPLKIRPVPLRKYHHIDSLNHARVDAITESTRLHDSLDEVHSTVSARNSPRRTEAQKFHYAPTNGTPITLYIVDYVMKRAHTQRKHKLQSVKRGPMRVAKVKFN